MIISVSIFIKNYLIKIPRQKLCNFSVSIFIKNYLIKIPRQKLYFNFIFYGLYTGNIDE
jgi:hypothetical protein